MQKLSKFAISQFALLVLVSGLGVGFWGKGSLDAQEDPKPPQSETETPAKDPAETPPKASLQETHPAAKELFESSRQKLRNGIYRAKIVQRLNFPDRSLEATGSIIRGLNSQLRLEFEIQIGGTKGKLVQVSNGDKLWTERRINNVTKLTVQDVKEILNKAKAEGIEETMVVAEMGLGGIASLLASMDRMMTFGEPQTVEVDGETLFRVEGEWNEEFLKRVQSNPQLEKGLPAFMPDGARVYFDREHFPRRIQYLKNLPDTEGMRPLVTLDFLDVEWLSEADVDPSLFKYTPPDQVFPEDVTKSYIEQLSPRQTGPAPPATAPMP
jgi:hypothetical protein